MGVLNTANMLRKAQQARSKMSKITVTGVSKGGVVAIALNGLNDMDDIEINENLLEGEEFDCLDTSVKQQLLATIQSETMQAFKQAKKNLEKELANNFDADSLSDILGN